MMLIKKIVVMALLVLTFAGVYSNPAYACETRFFTLKPWHAGLAKDGECNIQKPEGENGIVSMVVKIILNVVDMILQLAAYAAIAFIIYGGILYILSDGQGGVQGAKDTIRNALIGLLISLFAIAIVNLIFGAV